MNDVAVTAKAAMNQLADTMIQSIDALAAKFDFDWTNKVATKAKDFVCKFRDKGKDFLQKGVDGILSALEGVSELKDGISDFADKAKDWIGGLFKNRDEMMLLDLHSQGSVSKHVDGLMRRLNGDMDGIHEKFPTSIPVQPSVKPEAQKVLDSLANVHKMIDEMNAMAIHVDNIHQAAQTGNTRVLLETSGFLSKVKGVAQTVGATCADHMTKPGQGPIISRDSMSNGGLAEIINPKFTMATLTNGKVKGGMDISSLERKIFMPHDSVVTDKPWGAITPLMGAGKWCEYSPQGCVCLPEIEQSGEQLDMDEQQSECGLMKSEKETEAAAAAAAAEDMPSNNNTSENNTNATILPAFCVGATYKGYNKESPLRDSACGEALEGDHITLSCGMGMVLGRAKFVSWGRPSGRCTDFKFVHGSCHM